MGKFPSGDKSVIEYPPCLLPAATRETVGPPPYCASFHLCIPHHLAIPNEQSDSGVQNYIIVSGTWLCPSVNAAGSPRHALHLLQCFALVCRGCVVVIVTKDSTLPAAATSPAPWRLTSLINARSCYLVSLCQRVRSLFHPPVGAAGSPHIPRNSVDASLLRAVLCSRRHQGLHKVGRQ